MRHLRMQSDGVLPESVAESALRPASRFLVPSCSPLHRGTLHRATRSRPPPRTARRKRGPLAMLLCSAQIRSDKDRLWTQSLCAYRCHRRPDAESSRFIRSSPDHGAFALQAQPANPPADSYVPNAPSTCVLPKDRNRLRSANTSSASSSGVA